ncbi:MAG: TetR/AcrR family transcriptional regulator [Streptosporangiaceae bacterium]
MKAAQTARQRARTELTREIKEEARRQLAAGGSAQLSLRAVARELGMASSALYRYFPSRDDLLTALIIDAYDSLGQCAEQAVAAAAQASIRARWHACCDTIRAWAIARPHEYALIYGSPVPGYQAPQETIGPAGRVPAVLGALLAETWTAPACAPATGAPTSPAGAAAAGGADAPGGNHASAPAVMSPRQPQRRLPEMLARQAETVAAIIAPGAPAPAVASALIAWTQLFGMISFELFGQLVGSADPADAFFGYAVEQMADLMGMPG